MGILNHILNIIFPAVCRQCGGSVSSDAPTAYFCKRCWDAIKWFDGPCCARCGVPYPLMSPVSPENPRSNPPLPPFSKGGETNIVPPFFTPGHLCGACRKNPPCFDRAVSAGPYEGTLAEAIKLFKYKKKIHVGRALADGMIASPTPRPNPPISPFSKGGLRGTACMGRLQSYYIIPVPLHLSRLREREFNQSAILALVIGERLGIPVLTDILLRERHTRPQVELDMKERKKNVVGAFSVQNEELIIDKDIILVDDVYTTGSTVNECAKSLKKNGAGMVYVVTIARMVG